MSERDILWWVHGGRALIAIGYYIAAFLVWILSAWTILAAIIEVARGRSKPWNPNVIFAVLFHGGTAILTLELTSRAVFYG